MKEYRWVLENKLEVELSLADPNCDFLIKKYKGKDVVEHAFLFNCPMVYLMPSMMRYCFEENVDLKQRKFLRDLPAFSDFHKYGEVNEGDLKIDFEIPLRENVGRVRSANEELVISSSLDSSLGMEVSFNSKDVPQFVEGILQVLKYKGVGFAGIECTNIIQYYFKCLENDFFKDS